MPEFGGLSALSGSTWVCPYSGYLVVLSHLGGHGMNGYG